MGGSETMRIIKLVTLPLLVVFAFAYDSNAQSTVTRFENMRMCNEFNGENAGAKIAACIADLPATGGTADARGLGGDQTITSTLTIGKPVTLLLGAATYTL